MTEEQRLYADREKGVSLSIHQGELIWARYNSYIVANSILLFIIGQILTSDLQEHRIFYLNIQSFYGGLTCLFWLISTIRGFESIEFWNYSVREIEEVIYKKHKTKINNPYSGYAFFRENKEVVFDIPNGNNNVMSFRRSPFSRKFSLQTKWTAYLSIGIFLAIYIIFLCLFTMAWIVGFKI